MTQEGRASVRDVESDAAARARGAAIPPLDLDAGHPTPLYHQIAQAIRWRIGTGELEPGRALPPLREAASRWGVSYHTVRRAYRELAREGFVDPVRGNGTRVLDSPASRPEEGPDLAAFLERFAGEARDRFGLARSDLAAALTAGLPEGPTGPRRAVLIECNDHQCADLARQVEARWAVDVIPWNLSRSGDPPPHPLIGTWFHYAEMRRRWPERIADMRFGALRLDPRVVDRIVSALARADAPRVTLCERDVGTGHQHAADLVAALPLEVEVQVRTTLPGEEDLEAAEGLFAIAPRMWGALPEPLRSDPRVVELRHVFEPGDLASIGRELHLRLGGVASPLAPDRSR